jgi:general secretion pathway protein A
MKNKNLLGLYGLKWNPFENSIPLEGIVGSKEIDHFCWRVENLVIDGGFAMITGDPGTGKSVTLRLLADRLGKIPEIKIGVISRPQSGLADLYRELGEMFEVDLRPSNRWGGFKGLRQKWHGHIGSTLFRPVLLVDEAQEMVMQTLNEIRHLSSTNFDSKNILTVIFCGDCRFNDKLRNPDLIPLGSRINVRLSVKSATKDELTRTLKGAIEKAGNNHLMTKELIEMLADHAAGNFRVMMGMSNTLLAEGVTKELDKLDEKLFFEVFNPTPRKK